MEKYFKLLIVLFIVAVAAVNCMPSLLAGNNLADSSLFLHNIEALASGEDTGYYICYGSGSVDCPNGIKVEYYVNNVR